MSKLSFRARALDATKPLPIYNAVDLPDLSEYNTINRTVPQMPTGMEKEEETERHLQDVIHAQQSNRNIKHVVIPTPENAINVPYYGDITETVHKQPAQYIRLPGLRLDEEVPDYDLDSEDEEWLSLQTNEKPLSSTHFERMMDKLEKGSGNTVLSDRDAQALLRDDEDLVLAVYEYWLGKRLRLGRALIPMVKQERRDGTANGSNPYLAFRKRTEKMQTRKNRKNDETAYMQMQKLKRDLDKAYTLTGMVKQRETKKHELATTQMDIFKKRYSLEDWSGNIMSSLSPVATQSATSRQNSNVSNSAWDGSSVLIKMEGGDDYDVHQVGRHEVLVSGTRKRRKKRYYFPTNSFESPLPPMPATPDKILHDASRNLSSDKLQGDEELDGKYTFRRKPHIKYCPARSRGLEWPWESAVEGAPLGASEGWSDGEEGNCTTRTKLPKPKRFRFSHLTLSGQYTGLCRRRRGRGGRVVIDRLYSDLDETDHWDTASDDKPMETEQPSLHSPAPSLSRHVISPNHTPPVSAHTSTSHTPSIARQQSEIVGLSAGLSAAREKLDTLLLRSQSMQAVTTPSRVTPTSSYPDSVVGGGGDRGGEGSRGEPPHKKSLHFVDVSLSPTLNQDFSPLPFILQPPPGLAPTEHAQFPHYAADYHQAGGEGGNGYVVGEFSLRRLPSFSDYREEMTTFSSLPTSHFTLRPSSTEAELQQSPTQFWNQTSFGYPAARSDSDSWNAGDGGENPPPHWQRKSAGEQFSGIHPSSSYPHPTTSSALGNYGSNLISAYSNSVKRSLAQQVSTDHENLAEANKKEMSRSSLSVTDSKTIVLTNSPAPRNSAGDRKREMDKTSSQQQHKDRLLSQQQQQKDRLPSQQQKDKLLSQQLQKDKLASQQQQKDKLLSQQQQKDKLLSQQQQKDKLPSQQQQKEKLQSQQQHKDKTVQQQDRLLTQQHNHKLVNSVTPSQHRMQARKNVGEDIEGDSERTKGSHKEGGACKEGGNTDSTKPDDIAEDAKSEVVASKSAETNGTTEKKGVISPGGVETKDAVSAPRKSDQNASSADVVPVGASTCVGDNNPSTSVSDKGSKNTDEAEKSAECKEHENSTKTVDVWSMKGPANGILSLNARTSAKKDRFVHKKRSDGLMGFSLDSVHRVTSQFIAKVVKKKKDDADSNNVVPSLSGILVRGSAGNRSGSNTPTILGSADVQTQQILPGGIGASSATVSGLGARLSAELHQAPLPLNNNNSASSLQSPLQENNTMVVAKGVEVKRTNSIGSDGIGVHVTLSSQSSGGLTAHHQVGSVGTNGTNFQEIFNSKRKLSENTERNTERGLKQALAGTVMNHNTLLETTTKPLLPQTIKNSSEVT